LGFLFSIVLLSLASMGEAKIFLMFLTMVFLKGAVSEVHTVGDELGWNTGANFGSWSRKYNFSVGDTLGM
jgi:hypothetical protein